MTRKIYLLALLLLGFAACDNDAALLEEETKREAERGATRIAESVYWWKVIRVESCEKKGLKTSLYKRFPNLLLPTPGKSVKEIDQKIIDYSRKGYDYQSNDRDDYVDAALHREFNAYIRPLFIERIRIIKNSYNQNDYKQDDVVLLNAYLTSSINLYTQSGDYSFIQRVFDDLDDHLVFEGAREEIGSFEYMLEMIDSENQNDKNRNNKKSRPNGAAITLTGPRTIIDSSYFDIPTTWNIAWVINSIEILKNEKEIARSLESALLKEGILSQFSSKDNHIDMQSAFHNDYIPILTANGVCTSGEASFIWNYTAFRDFKLVDDKYYKISKSIFDQSKIID